MILYRWRGTSTNFGDELNTILWPSLLPAFFDQDASVRFVGIGSVLDRRHPPDVLKLVAGSGYGGYEPKARLDESWVVHWVRGPRTAATMGLPASLALGDPAALLPMALEWHAEPGTEIGFMPHFESMARGAWQQVAAEADVRLIDPRGDPLEIMHAISRCKVVLSEALHGVIVADALRVPWVAIRPLARIHRAKWQDWADTMNVTPRFRALPGSTLEEWIGAGPLKSWHSTARWISTALPNRARFGALIDRASDALRRAAAAEPQLSADTVLQRCQCRMLDAVHAIAANPLRSTRYSARSPARRLQQETESAYQLKPVG